MKTTVALAVLLLVAFPAFAGDTVVVPVGDGGGYIAQGDSGTTQVIPDGSGGYVIDN